MDQVHHGVPGNEKTKSQELFYNVFMGSYCAFASLICIENISLICVKRHCGGSDDKKNVKSNNHFSILYSLTVHMDKSMHM